MLDNYLGRHTKSGLINGIPMEPYGTGAEIRYRLPIATLGIIAINVVIYVITSISNGLISINTKWLYTGGFIPILLLQDISNVYRIFTSMFLHADILHIFFNMYFLYIFGKAIENTIGSVRFLILYLISGIAATVFHTAFSMLQGPSALAIPAIGASGAISGVLGAYLILYPGTSLTACWFFFLFPMCFTMNAAYYLLFWFALQVIYGYARLGASIAFFAHAGGFVAGIAILPVVVDKTRHYIIKMRSVTGSIFDFIIYGTRRYFSGLPRTAKIILALLIASLLIGAAYVSFDVMTKKPTGIYVAKADIEIPSLNMKYMDNVVLEIEKGVINPTDIPTDETRILFNRLVGANLLFNTNLAGKEVTIRNKEFTIKICNVRVPLMVKEFKGVYNEEGVLINGEGSIVTRVAEVTYVGGRCYARLGSWIDYVFRIHVPTKTYITEGIGLTSLIALITSLSALYVSLRMDKELVIVE